METSPAQPDSAPPCVESFAALVAVDPFTLSALEQVELLQAWERHIAWVEAMRAQALAAFAGPGSDFGDHPDLSDSRTVAELYRVDDSVQDEVAVTLRLSSGTAQRRIAVARDLDYKLPLTRDLLRSGGCSYAQAVVVSDECERLSVLNARLVEEEALSRVGSQTPAQTRRSVRRAAARLCPPDPAAAVEEEFARRDVQLWHDGGVMATIQATVPAPDAMAIWNALTGCAARDERANDSRTMAHKRADALTAWAQQALASDDMPALQGKKRLETQVVIDAATLVGLADNPGEIVGYGPIPAVLARRLAAESDHWRRLVTDPVTGHLLDYGHRTYTPPTSVREYIIARDRTCQFPGCGRGGYQCDIDHVDPFTGNAEGGSTGPDNLVTLCRRHHRLKTHNHWRVKLTDQGVEWSSPRGLVHLRARPKVLEDAGGGSSRDHSTCTEAEPTEFEVELRQMLDAA